MLKPRGGLDALDLEYLNELAEAHGVRTESGATVRFVRPDTAASRYGGYELRVYESGCVETREGNLHDLFNALAWLSWPRTKARLNALHAREIPRENGRRGRLRDLLTLIDEGGAVLCCSEAVAARIRGHRWMELFWERRNELAASLKVNVLGHAIFEQALQPRPDLTCKAILLPGGAQGDGADSDRRAAEWLGKLPADATPATASVFPVFGMPGWHPGTGERAFYEDTRFFRPLPPAGRMTAGVGRAAAARGSTRAEESPGSAERNAG